MTLIEPIRTLPSKHQVTGARTVANLQTDKPGVQIWNPSLEWVYLKANEPDTRIDNIENNAVLCEIDDSPPKCVYIWANIHSQYTV